MTNPYRRDDLRKSWDAGRRAYRASQKYDEMAWHRGFRSIASEEWDTRQKQLDEEWHARRASAGAPL